MSSVSMTSSQRGDYQQTSPAIGISKIVSPESFSNASGPPESFSDGSV